ncbi:MAG: hypothetical protein H7257_04610 [Taibaiella sp.]|nr:hypothetical protein [Taibaiella sp.]
MNENLARMLLLVDEVFDVKNDPGQLNVDEEVMERLKQIHPATLSEYDDGNGPAAWVLVLPTTKALMNDFLKGVINERQLAEFTLPCVSYDAVYLCSAIVLPEHRRKGIAKDMSVNAIKAIMEQHDILSLFCWPFTTGGESLAQSIAGEMGLELLLLRKPHGNVF